MNNTKTETRSSFLAWIGIVFLVYLLMVGVGVIGAGFKWISGGPEGAEMLFSFANMYVPFVLTTCTSGSPKRW